MKKLCVFALILALLLPCAAAENSVLADWLKAYNALAPEHGLKALDAAEFSDLMLGGSGYLACELENDMLFMLSFNSDGSVYLCAVQAKPGDLSALSVLSCALVASDGKFAYESAYEIFQDLYDEVKNDGDEAADATGGWYFVASYDTDEDGTSVMLGFAGLNINLPDDGSGIDLPDGGDDGLPGDIWHGIDGDEGGESDKPAPGPTPAPTPAPDPKIHKI